MNLYRPGHPVLLLLLGLLLAGCGGGGSDAEFVDDRRLLQQIIVAPEEAEIAAGRDQAFTATGQFSDGTEENLTDSVTWSSSDESVAIVDTAGLVTALNIGSASIRASQDGITGQASLSVTEAVIVQMAILPPVADIPKGTTRDYRAFAIYSDDSFRNVTFEVEWSLRDESGIIRAYEPVLTRGLNALDDFGTVIGVEVGEDELVIASAGVSADAAVVVSDPQLAGVVISPVNETRPEGSTITYTATGNFTDGTSADITKVVSWQSSDTSVASISNDPGSRGLASALLPGQTTISASIESFVDETSLFIVDDGGDDITRVDVIPAQASIVVDQALSFRAFAITRDGDSFDVTGDAGWTSSNPDVAIVDAGGLATGVAPGDTTIDAVFDDVQGSASLAVTGPILESINVTPINQRLVSFTATRYTATGTFSDGSKRNLTTSATWQSDSPSTILVSNDPEFGHGTAFGLIPGETLVRATIGGLSDTAPVTVIAPEDGFVSLAISPAVAEIPVGGTEQYKAELIPLGQPPVDVTRDVNWRSDDIDVARIDPDGLASGIGSGTTAIIATLTLGDLTLSESVSLEVLAAPVTVVDLVVSPPSANVLEGESQGFTARALLSDDRYIDVTREVSWTTTDPAVAVVDDEGVATGIEAGSVTIKARLTIDGSSFEDTAELAVVRPAVVELVVNPPAAEILPGNKVSFTARAQLENGTSEDVTTLVTWRSDDESVAQVDDRGVATGTAPGSAVIEAELMADGQTWRDTANLTVTPPPVTIDELIVNPATAEVLVAATQAFTAKVVLSDATEQDVTDFVSWTSDDSAIAVINGEGLATGISPGETSVTASLLFEDTLYETDATLNVLPPAVVIESLVVEPPRAEILVEGSTTFTARVILSDSTSQDVTDQVSWLSSDNNIAHVSSTGVATGISPGTSDISATLLYQGDSFSDSSELTVLPPAVTVESVRVLPPAARVYVDGTLQYLAEAVLSDGRVIDVTGDVNWTSGDNTIAVVSASGLATGVSAGESTITATLTYEGENVSGSATLTVDPPEISVEELIVEPVTGSVLTGSSLAFTARLIFSDESQQVVTGDATWTSSDYGVASVDTGVATGLGAGDADITAAINISGTIYMDSALLTVTDPAPVVTGIRVAPASAEIVTGTTFQFQAFAELDDGSEQDITRDVTWISGNPGIVHVDTTGLATGLAAGITDITARFSAAGSSYEDAAEIEVKPEAIVPTALTISPEDTEVLINGTVQYSAIVQLSDGSTQDVTDDVDWQSQAPEVAQIDSGGLATAISPGTAPIRAQLDFTDGQVEDTASLTVSAPDVVVEQLVITPDGATLIIPTQQQYTAIAELSNGSSLDVTADVTWTSDDASIVSVNIGGLATPQQPGETFINAALVTEFQSISSSVAVTVDDRMVDDLQIFPAALSDAAGTIGLLQAEAHYNDNTKELVTQLAEWRSDDPDVARVSNTFPRGAYVLRTSGETTITASYAGFSDTIPVSVSAPPLVAIIVSPIETATPVGVDVAFIATGLYANLTSSDLTDDVTWTSSDPSVSAITSEGTATGLMVGSATISAAFEGLAGEAEHIVTAAAINGLVMSPPIHEGPAGTTQQFEAFAQYTDGTQKNVTAQTNWQSSDDDIVSVETGDSGATPGLARLVASGRAEVTATFEGFTDIAPVQVSAPVVVDLFVNPYGETYPAGLLVEFTAIATYDNGTDKDVTTDATWHSLDGDVIVSNPDQAGQFQTVAPGTTEVTATFAGITEDAPVTVTPAAVIELQVTPTNPTGPAGTQDFLSATAFYDNLTSEDVTDQATWASADSSVANIVPGGEDAGLLQFLSEGTTDITATFEGVTQTTTATTTAAVLIDIVVQPPNISLANGLTQQYEAIGLYSDGTSAPLINSGGIQSRILTDEVVWSTDDRTVAQIDPDGLATAVDIGTTQVTAAFEGLTGATSLTVTDATVVSLEIQPRESTGPAGTDERVEAIAELTDNSRLNVTGLVVWGSSSGFVATVAYDSTEAIARLSFNNQGTATISATLGSGPGAIVAEADAITTSAVLERIELVPDPLALPAGNIGLLVATGYFSDDTAQRLNDDADFTSLDPVIAAVNQFGLVSAATVGSTTITASLGDISGTAVVEVTDAVLTELQVTPADVTGPAGSQEQLTATGIYSDSSTQVLTGQVTWRSDDTGVAAISSGTVDPGLLQLVAEGSTQVSAVLNDVVDVIDVQVLDAELVSIRIRPVVSVMPSGTTQQLLASGDYSDNTSRDITAEVTWNSRATDQVQISDSGLATAFDEGIATISAQLDGRTGLAEILVTAPSLVNLQVTPSTLVEPAGSSGQFTATGIYSNGFESDLTEEVVWDSSDTDVVTVNNFLFPGRASLKQVGSAAVSASLEGIVDSVPVEVTSAVLTEIRINPSVESVAEGTEVQYSATGVYSDGTTTPINQDVNWSTSNIDIATISEDGLADTVGEGIVEIRAAFDDIIGTADLEVTDAIPEFLEILPPTSPPLLVGQSRSYEALLTYSDGETAVVTGQVDWQVEPAEIASPQTTPGLIRGVSPGSGEVIGSYGSFAFGRSDSSLQARVPLDVAAPEIVSVEINTFREAGQPVEIPAGRSEAWQAFANFSDGTFVEITDDAVWASDNQAVATVLDGDVNALVAGETSIEIFYIDLEDSFQAPSTRLSQFTDSVNLTVTDAILQSIVINPPDAVIAPGQTASFTAIGTYSDNTSANITGDANWDTGNGDIAVIDRVSDTATVRGLAVGTTVVTVASDGQTATANLEVTDAQVPAALTVSSSLPVSVGSQWPFTAEVTYSDGDTAIVTNDANWSSGTTSVATVYNVPDQPTPRGTASTISAGETTITASFEGLSGSQVLQVTGACEASSPNGKPDSVFIIPDQPILENIGDVVQMQAIGVFLDDCQTSLTLDPQTQWKVTGQGGSSKVIEVNDRGLVTGLKCGEGEVEANHRGVKATMTIQVCS